MKYIILVFTFIVISCSGVKEVPKTIGKYVYLGSSRNNELVIYSNGKYYYKGFYGMNEQYGEGIWSIDSNSIILSSEKIFGIIKVVEKREEKDTIRIILLSELKDPIGYANIYYYGKENGVLALDADGKASLKRQSIGSFTISFLGIKYKYNVMDSIATSFDITLALKEEGYPYFLNERWIIKGDSLIDPGNAVWEKSIP